MDYLLIVSLVGGVAIVFLLAVAKFTLRWLVRLVIVGLLLLVALGGVAWWWLERPATQSDTKPRSTPARRASSDRR